MESKSLKILASSTSCKKEEFKTTSIKSINFTEIIDVEENDIKNLSNNKSITKKNYSKCSIKKIISAKS